MNATATVAGGIPLRPWLLAAFVVTLGGILTGSAYFAVGGIFALISDLFGLGMGLIGLVLVIGLHDHVAARRGERAPAVRSLGVVAYVLTIVGSFGLVLLNLGMSGIHGGLFLATQFAGMATQGGWFLGFGLLVLGSATFDRTSGWLFVTAGIGYVSFGLAAVVAPGSVAAMAGGFVGVFVYLYLVLRLRRLLAPG